MLPRVRQESAKHLSHRRRERWDTTGVLLELPPKGERMNFAAIFGNRRPVEMEIGTGKGTFLLARAAARLEINFLGIEHARAYCRYAADRIRRARLTNVRMLHAEAMHLFGVYLAAGCLWRLHVYFPDPWPKRRHRRRRLIQPGFLAAARRALRPGGQLLIVTDHLDYFRQIAAVLEGAEGFARIAFPRMTDAEGLTGTNFERKYIAQGRCFYAAARLRHV